MAQGNPMPGEMYRHFKDKLYQIVSVAYHSETMERYVVYQALYGDFKTYIRPYDMFISEVDHEKYPDVEQKYRFAYLGNIADAREEGKGERQPKSPILNRQSDNIGRKENRKNPGESEEIAVKDCSDQSDNEATGESINPWLERFLDAADFDEKYKIVCDMGAEVTDRLIDDIAVIMDFSIPEGDLSERYEQLKYCMRTRRKYENGRLR